MSFSKDKKFISYIDVFSLKGLQNINILRFFKKKVMKKMVNRYTLKERDSYKKRTATFQPIQFLISISDEVSIKDEG